MRKGLIAEDMRYAFVGNMNNMSYLFSRAMKTQGIDVVLYLDAPPAYKLDRPEACDPNLSYPYPSWIKEMAMPRLSHFVKRLAPRVFYRKLIKELNSYDVVVLNGNWITLAAYLNKKLTIYSLCAGYEIDVLCDLDNIDIPVESILYKLPWFAKINFAALPLLINFLSRPIFKRRISLQRKGILRSDGVNYYPTGISPKGDGLIDEIKGNKKYRRLELRGIPTDEFKYVKPKIHKKKFTIINFTRFSFLTERHDDKRNDIMLEGIGLFLKNIDFKDDIEILFFNKGEEQSLKKAKEIINRLNYSKYVTWSDAIPQEELFSRIVPECDVAFDQLGSQWIGAGLYAMLIGRPVIANGRPEVFESLTKEVSPVCQATTPEEVCYWLKRLYYNREEIKEIGLASRNYVEKHYRIDDTVNFFLGKN